MLYRPISGVKEGKALKKNLHPSPNFLNSFEIASAHLICTMFSFVSIFIWLHQILIFVFNIYLAAPPSGMQDLHLWHVNS